MADDWPDTECGILKVPENYNKPDARKVELPFIIFKAKVPNKNTYPLVVAGGGGPGGGLGISALDEYTIGDFLWMNWYSSTIEAGRDLILIDNRGVGSARPKLDCPEVETADMASLDKILNQNELVQLIRESYGACKHRLLAQGIDISQYHVTNAAKDLEQLRIGLAVKQLNVYGASYGSRIALVFERLYPGSVRAMILDGVYPQSIKVYENEPRRNSQAIMRVIEKCKADSYCYDQFGYDFEARLSNYLEQLDKTPLKIKVTSPVDFSPVEVVVTPDVFFDSIYTALYDATVISYLPKYLYATFKGNTDYLTQLVREYYVNELSVNSLDVGAYASYACFDQIPFTDYTEARSELDKYPFQHYSNALILVAIETMCDVWAVPLAPSDFKEPYKINTPVLVYSGELDPVTPSEMAKPVVENARKAWQKVWSNISHGVMYSSQCADWTAQAFLGDPESDPFIYECSDYKSRFIFDVR